MFSRRGPQKTIKTDSCAVRNRKLPTNGAIASKSGPLNKNSTDTVYRKGLDSGLAINQIKGNLPPVFYFSIRRFSIVGADHGVSIAANTPRRRGSHKATKTDICAVRERELTGGAIVSKSGRPKKTSTETVYRRSLACS